MFFWQLMAIIDISSHWAHWHANDLTGGASHKNVTEVQRFFHFFGNSILQKTNPILRLYYTSRPFLFFMCLGNEAFYSFSYLCYFTHGPRLPVIG
jgi:CDP-diacylglycerol--inositol 3-phosphatidyltransferase